MNSFLKSKATYKDKKMTASLSEFSLTITSLKFFALLKYDLRRLFL